LEIRGQRRLKIVPFASARMMEAEFPRVQHLTRKIFRETPPINFVAKHRMTEVTKMHANLMGAPAV
jgi:hypothetical protein